MEVIKGNQLAVTASGSVNPANNFDLDAGICLYNGKPYLYTRTNNYWEDSSRGNVLELRRANGAKIKDVGSKEVTDWSPQNWDVYEDLEGKPVPQSVKDFYDKL